MRGMAFFNINKWRSGVAGFLVLRWPLRAEPASSGMESSPRYWTLTALLIAGLTLAEHAVAATYCVDTTANIQNGLCTSAPADCSLRGAIANANNGNEGTIQEIRVPTGTYAVPGGLNFNPGGNKDDKTFTLTGGWNAGCTSHTLNAANTVLDAENGATDGTFNFEGDQREFVIEGLTFRHFRNWQLYEPGCGAFDICPNTDRIRIRLNAFRQGGATSIFSSDAAVYSVEGNLFANLDSGGDSFGIPVVLSYFNGDSTPIFAFNTFANVHCSISSNTAVQIRSSAANSKIDHNIIQSDNCLGDLSIDNESNAALVLRNNLYSVFISDPMVIETGSVITSDPGFMNAAAGDYRLHEAAPVSAAVNTGLTPIQAAQVGIAFPSQDLDGPAGSRLIGTRVDIGAYESSINNASVISVTNNADSGAGSLRQAVISANGFAGPQKIEFSLPGSCPQLIFLQSPLPDITDSVEIDGYSQQGSSANTQTNGSDAELCVVLTAASGTLAQVFQVPDDAPASTSLVLKGIAFAGATGFNGNMTAALRLRGGSDHLIQGNAFGGIGPGSIGSLGSPNFGIQIRGVAQNALIGGPQPEHRNSFGSTISSAIVLNDATSGNITGHTIQNNYIGVSAFGTTATAIGLNGIFASNSPNVSILDNTIVAVPNNAAIQIQGATATNYRIRGNRIGLSPYSVATVVFRVDTGIEIGAGSGGHEIGDLIGTSQSNTITNSNGAGILISSSAGNGTIIRPNRIYGNGMSGVGLGIDLGALGPLANDAGDADGGPNGGQNWPVVSASLPNSNGTRQVSVSLGSTPSTNFIIDVYRSPDCAGGDRGGNMTTRVLSSGVATSANGNASVNAPISGIGAPGFLTATATNLSTGDTSEVGTCFSESNDVIFANGFQ